MSLGLRNKLTLLVLLCILTTTDLLALPISLCAYLVFIVIGKLTRVFYKEGTIRAEEVQSLILGLCLSLVPGVGSQYLLCIALTFLFIQSDFNKTGVADVFKPFITLIVVWYSTFLLIDLTQFSFSSLIALAQDPIDTFPDLIQSFQSLPERSTLSLRIGLSLITAVLFFSYFVENLCSRQRFINGAIWGAGLSCFVAILQQVNHLYGPVFEMIGMPSGFWAVAGRAGGLFSDPNSLGIFCGILIPALLSPLVERRYLYLLPGVSVFVAPIFTGSRTFILALIILLLYLLLIRARRMMIVVCVLGVAFILLLNTSDSFSALLTSEGSPLGIRRVVESLRIGSLQASFYSRSIFWEIAIKMWLDHPFFGVGIGRFSEALIPYNFAVGARESMWIDNPNSFYLGILAEGGIFAALLLFLSLSRLKFLPKASILDKAPVVVMTLLLILGPHLDFHEVALLFVALSSTSVIVRDPQNIWGLSRSLSNSIPILLTPFISLLALSGEYGLYGWSKVDDGYWRWSSQNSRVAVPCIDGIAKIDLLGGRGDVSPEHPLEVSLHCDSYPERKLSIQSQSIISQLFSCSYSESQDYSRNIWCDIHTPKVFIPARRLYNEDYRRLGVKVGIGRPFVPN